MIDDWRDDGPCATLVLHLGRGDAAHGLAQLHRRLDAWSTDVTSHALLIRGGWAGGGIGDLIRCEAGALARLPRPTKPIIALVEADCLDLGLVLLGLLSHIRIASSAARFGFPEVATGVAGAAALSGLARQMAYLPLRQWALTGRLADAGAALRAGLVTETGSPDRASALAEEWLQRMASLAPLAIQSEIAAIRHTQGQAHESARAFRFGHTNISMFDADAVEGPLAFEQKRAPRYRGARHLLDGGA